MPMINADDGCPINVEVEGPRQRAGADAVELARHQPDTCGTIRPANGRKHFRADALRPPRPWPIRRAEGPLFHGAVRPRRARRARRARASRRPTGAACRWAAWSGNGSAPMRPTASRSSFSPTRTTITPTRARGTTASSSCSENGLDALVDPNMERWFTAGFRAASAGGDRAHEGDVPHHQSGRLHRLLRGDPRHGFPRPQPAHHGADAGHRRRAGPGHAARRPAKRSQQQIKGAKLAALDAAHISNIEQPQAYTETVLNFLS